MFENRVPRKVFGPKNKEVNGDCRRWYSEGFYELYFLPNISRVIKTRRIRLAGRVARMREGGYTKNFRGES